MTWQLSQHCPTPMIRWSHRASAKHQAPTARDIWIGTTQSLQTAQCSHANWVRDICYFLPPGTQANRLQWMLQICRPLSLLTSPLPSLLTSLQSLAVAGGGVWPGVQTVTAQVKSPWRPQSGRYQRLVSAQLCWSPGLVSLRPVALPAATTCPYLPPSPQMSSLQPPFVPAPRPQDGNSDCFRDIKMMKTAVRDWWKNLSLIDWSKWNDGWNPSTISQSWSLFVQKFSRPIMMATS